MKNKAHRFSHVDIDMTQWDIEPVCYEVKKGNQNNYGSQYVIRAWFLHKVFCRKAFSEAYERYHVPPPPRKDLSEAYAWADDFIEIDDAIRGLKQQPKWTNKPRETDTKPNVLVKREPNNSSLGNGKPFFLKPSYDSKVYTYLNTIRTKILKKIKDKPFIEPCLAESQRSIGTKRQLYLYHQGKGHSMEA